MPPSENSEAFKYNLPPPANESGPENSAEKTDSTISSQEAAPKLSTPKTVSNKTQAINLKLQDYSVPQSSTNTASTTSVSTPLTADDDDLIEKEWVEKAKKIIEQTRENPKHQSKEISLFRADYMKKRYNKVIKVDE